MKKENYKKLYWSAAILAIFLLTTTSYYLLNLEKLDRRSDIIGDALCGNLPDAEAQDYCCTRAHKNDVTAKCLGGWQYLEGIKYCQYVCNENEPSCPKETKSCQNGESVTRNASNECRFDECIERIQ